jgi:hypothetical protein
MVQIAPNPNPLGNTIAVSGTDSNTETFDNNGAIEIIENGILSNSGILNNYYALNNNGTLKNSGFLNNYNSLGNYNTIDNSGSFYNGNLLENANTINNTGVLNNSGDFKNFGILDNSGILDNFGILGNSVSLNNSGVFNNYSGFDNAQLGTIYNSGSFQNRSFLTNHGYWHNSGSLNNYNSFENGSVLDNWGSINNFSFFTNFVILDNYFGEINNYGFTYNKLILNNYGIINNYGILINDLSLDNSGGSFFNFGTLAGSGIFYGDLEKGIVAPGGVFSGSPQDINFLVDTNATLTVQGNYTLNSSATLSISIGGKDAGEYDVLNVVGTANLIGNIALNIDSNFLSDITLGQTVDIPFLQSLGITSSINFAQIAPADTLEFDFEVISEDNNLVLQATRLLDLNDAPILNPVLVQSLLSGDTTPVGIDGISVMSFLGNSITDFDNGALQGIAVTNAVGKGTWQYSTNNGVNWNAIGSVSDSSALLLTPEMQVRFIPDATFDGTANLSFRAWDQTSGTPGTLVNTTMNGETTAFSTAIATTSLSLNVISGTTKNDSLLGTSSADFINGYAKNDTIWGNEGSDILYGGDGNDELHGGIGNNYLDGGKGNDKIYSSGGQDTIVLASGNGIDTLYNYSAGSIHFRLNAGLTFGALTIGQDGNNTSIRFGHEHLASLVGVQASQISESNFF